jgi:hypothetical protein
VLRTKTPEEVPAAITRLAQASLRVSDIWFTVRNRATESITDEVADFLTERNIKFERGEKLPGRSGKIWSVDFHTWTPERSSLVYVLSTGSKAGARSIVNQAVATFYDLSHMRASQGLGFVSLFDDTMDVWADEDFNLASSLSEIGRWSRPDEFENLLKAA